jgi:hypothetical protein
MRTRRRTNKGTCSFAAWGGPDDPAPHSWRLIFGPAERQLQTMDKDIRVFDVAVRAGFTFRTEGIQARKRLMTDNANLACDFLEREANEEKSRAYATITRLLFHELYPGGRKLIVAECRWHESLPNNVVTQSPQVRHNEEHGFNKACRFTFLKTCCAIPIALLPHDPDDLESGVFDVFDKNLTFEEL